MKQTKYTLLIFITALSAVLSGCLRNKKNCYYPDNNNNKHRSDNNARHCVDTGIDVRQKRVKNHSQRRVTIENGINKEMLGYKKFGTHYPDTFRILIDDKELMQGEKEKHTIKNNILIVRYEYRFGKRRDGAKLVYFELDPQQKKFTIRFKWKDEWRILINDAKPLKIKELA